jgi:hypothetical protein
MSEKPVHSRLRRLVDWINLTGAKKVHSLIDKVYKRKNPQDEKDFDHEYRLRMPDGFPQASPRCSSCLKR